MTMPSLPPGGSFPSGEADPLGDRLLEHRIILATGHLDGTRASELCARLVTLDAAGEEPVRLHLQTPDGDLEAAFAAADTVNAVTCPVHVLVIGQVGGPPLAVLTAARRREMTPHAVLRLAEPRAGLAVGGATDLAAREEEHRHLVDAFYLRLAETTGREADEIRADAREDRLLTADEAVAYGLVHSVVARP
ncbi:ClpP family protease [Actinoallomurus soli]|uniref:ClpP family protease n=1 Tax=Actinoallomurus soli TaxID=2952535 RepID=UPI002092B158|nr:ATP-dependent Clp protease proteolytic subunit [Actinoallomurus soli]MCO5973672.1 ATP-dependent Clp protease proteolytic subunit [Actinoallomurus soli]